jgi:AraC-like DNA-binding protein
MRRPDHHNEIELNLLESGTVTYLLSGRKVRVEAGHLSVFWGAIPHQIIDFRGDPAYFVATIPLPWFLQWRMPEHFVQPLLRGDLISTANANRAACDVHLFSRWENDLQPCKAGPQRSVLLEMHARLVRLNADGPAYSLASPKNKVSTSTFGAGGLNKAERMACFIAQNYTTKLTVQRVADAVDLHPNYAMTLFQDTLGATLIDYITQHRVSHAQRLLATTNDKIIDVAFASGFTSLSRFNQAFRRACSCPPREYRQTHIIEDLSKAV